MQASARNVAGSRQALKLLTVAREVKGDHCADNFRVVHRNCDRYCTASVGLKNWKTGTSTVNIRQQVFYNRIINKYQPNLARYANYSSVSHLYKLYHVKRSTIGQNCNKIQFSTAAYVY